MARSIWKGPFVDPYLLKIAEKAQAAGKKGIIKVWSRRSSIIPMFVGLKFGVYNGKIFVPVSITEEMVGQKLGEYAPTRTYHGHGADKQAKRK